MTAFFLFQGWGNLPSEFTTDDLQNLENALAVGDLQEATIPQKRGWSFIIPTSAPICMLDCRTMRSSDRGGRWFETWQAGGQRIVNPVLTPTQLVNSAELRRMAVRLRNEFGSCNRLVLGVNTPIFGQALVEHVQTLSRGFFSRVLDLENWELSPQSWISLLEDLLHPCHTKELIILAGDVHYSFTAEGRLSDPGGNEIKCLQYVSSPTKNEISSVRLLQGIGSRALGTTRKIRLVTAVWNSLKRVTFGVRAVPDIGVDEIIDAAAAVTGEAPYKKIWAIDNVETAGTISELDLMAQRVEHRFIK